MQYNRLSKLTLSYYKPIFIPSIISSYIIDEIDLGDIACDEYLGIIPEDNRKPLTIWWNLDEWDNETISNNKNIKLFVKNIILYSKMHVKRKLNILYIFFYNKNLIR